MDFTIPVFRYTLNSQGAENFVPPEADIKWLSDRLGQEGTLYKASATVGNTVIFTLVPEFIYQGPDEDALSQMDIELALTAVPEYKVKNGELFLLGGINRRLIGQVIDKELKEDEFMQVKQKDGWLGRKMDSLKNEDLLHLFEEISSFRASGVLQGENLIALEKEFSDNVSHTAYGECMRLVEDAVLYEMARRHHNANTITGEWAEYTGEDAGFHYCPYCKMAAFNYQDGENVTEVLSPYCPNCGMKLSSPKHRVEK